MGEANRSSPRNESFSLMKHWLLTKFQIPSDGRQGESRNKNTLPKIVISRGSNKSINKMDSPVNSPMFKRPSPLAKTWTNCKELPLMSAPCNSSNSFWSKPVNYSPPLACPSREKIQPRTPQIAGSPRSIHSASLPCTPITADFTSICALKSPIFRFSQKNKIPISGELTPATSAAWSRSDLDSESVCGACGQEKYYGSRDFVGFASPVEDVGVQSAVNSPKLAHRQLKLRRTSSCRAPDNSERQLLQKSATITKAASNVDVQKRTSSKTKRVMRTGSKERQRSTISLTRSWSINLDTFRIIRNDSAKSREEYDRKMSLNDNELRRQKEERRRSSILRLLCHEQYDSEKEDKCDTISISDSNSEVEISDYSPKVTRASNIANGDPLEVFKSTLESDSLKIPSIYGQIKLLFQYFNEKNEFQVTLLKGSNVAPGQIGTLGIYTKVCLMPGKIQLKTGDDKHDTRNPVFYEPFTFSMSLDELLQRQLRIKLYNKPGIFSTSEPIGECSIALYNYDLTAVTVIWQNLHKCKNQKDDLDQFDFSPLERHFRRRRKFRFFLCGIGKEEEVDVDERT